MRSKLITLLFSFITLTGNMSAQSDTTRKHLSDTSLTVQRNSDNSPGDDEFNLFLLTLLMIAISAMIGAAIIGAFAATTVLFLLIAFISFGVLSVSVLAGLYRRSITTGFKTFLYIVCPLAGMLIGALGFWIISRLFTLSISTNKGLLAAATGGLLGGILMAFALSKIVTALIKYFWKKINQTDSGNPK